MGFFGMTRRWCVDFGYLSRMITRSVVECNTNSGSFIELSNPWVQWDFLTSWLPLTLALALSAWSSFLFSAWSNIISLNGYLSLNRENKPPTMKCRMIHWTQCSEVMATYLLTRELSPQTSVARYLQRRDLARSEWLWRQPGRPPAGRRWRGDATPCSRWCRSSLLGPHRQDWSLSRCLDMPAVSPNFSRKKLSSSLFHISPHSLGSGEFAGQERFVVARACEVAALFYILQTTCCDIEILFSQSSFVSDLWDAKKCAQYTSRVKWTP